MAAVNASRNRFIVCRQCLKIRGDTRRMRVILGPSIRGFLLFAFARSRPLSPGILAVWGDVKKKRVVLQ